MTTRLDVEKGSSLADDDHGAHVVRSDTELEKDGGNLVLQVEDAAAAGLKTAKGGRTILVPQPNFWGRLPVLFWTQLIGTFMVLGSVLVQDFNAYYALRPLTSLFLTAGQTIGLTFVKGESRFAATGITSSSSSFGVSPNDLTAHGGQSWVVFAWSCFVLLVIFLADETWYDRSLPVQPSDPPASTNDSATSSVSPESASAPTSPTPSPRSCMRLFEVFTKPTLWMVFIVYALSFMWAVGINITSSIILATPKVAGGYGLTLKQTSVVYLTPLVALILGEGIEHVANDWIANKYLRKHNGVFKPECRLYIFPFASVLMIAGLVLVGQARAKGLSVGAIVLGSLCVAITAYILDVFPSASGEVSAAVNLSRTISGFSVGYLQAPWGAKMGYDVSFGIQAAIVAFAMGLVFVLIAIGERIRKFGGPLHFAKHQ
ncbi:hypothetical protein JCM10296v2_003188 [Rhodotorula toruloides]